MAWRPSAASKFVVDISKPDLRRAHALPVADLFDESVAASPPPGLTEQSRSWVERLRARGIREVGGPLQPVSAATTVRSREDRVLLGDAAFAQTTEQIAGFDVVECADLDEAVAIASLHPVAKVGTIEVRPVRLE